MNLHKLGIVACLALLGSPCVQADPASLEDLLKRVEENSVIDSKENEARLEEFKNNLQKQKTLLEEVKQALEDAKTLSLELKDTYDKNELMLADLETQRSGELGDLNEIFGNVRQVSGQFKNIVETSLTASEIPGRSDFFADLGESKALPKIEELEKLWYEILRETVESGKVSNYEARVVNAEGVESTASVVRVGVFNAFNEDGFLNFLPETGQLAMLPRQPAGRYLDPVVDFYNASDKAMLPIVLDPSQGAMLNAFANTPDLSQRIEQGKTVGYVILGLLGVGLILSLFRWLFLTFSLVKMKAQLKDLSKPTNNPLGRIVSVYNNYDKPDVSVETLELKIDEAIMKEIPRLESGLSTIKIFAAVAPLLGLLGTVTGMIATFQSITLFGTGDPKLMAGGISQALVTTVLGLVAAIPLILVHTFLKSISDSCTALIEEQGAGLIASFSEEKSKDA
ncbi:MAG: MotA/TolQ/ExbB proton channel family protein [Opitutales bacterium]